MPNRSQANRQLPEPAINRIWFLQWLFFLLSLLGLMAIAKVLLDITRNRSAWDERTVPFLVLVAAMTVIGLRRSIKAHRVLKRQQSTLEPKESASHETQAQAGPRPS